VTRRPTKTANLASPSDFSTKVIKAELAPYQKEILDAIPLHKRVAVRGPHGLGKTMMAACAVLWALTTFGQDAKIITTASVWRQLSKYLWPEIRKWGLKLKRQMPGLTILQESARYGEAEAFGVASDKPEFIEGAHAAKLMYVLDEAKIIPPPTWDAIEGAFSTGECVLGSAVVAGAGLQAVARRWYEGEVIEIETIGGHNLTVTPNHPILTRRGWVLAGSLKPVDEVIACRDANALMLRIEPDAKQVPARIKDIFEAHGMLNRTFAGGPVMLRSKDFNSAVPDGKISVEASNSFLNDWLVTMFNKELENPCLMSASNKPVCFSGFSSLGKFKLRLDLSSVPVSTPGRPGDGLFGVHGDIGALRLSNVPALRSKFNQALGDDAIRDIEFSTKFSSRDTPVVVSDKRLTVRRIPFGVASKHSACFNAVEMQVPGDCAGRDVELFSKIDGVATGLVFTDKISNLKRRKFSGHVYNLQTSTRWFTASDSIADLGGIITHNCYVLAISTPGDRAGRFWDIHRRAPGFEDWWVRHVTLDEAMAAGRISPEWAQARLEQWGADSPVYQARVLGEFPQQSDDILFNLAWVEAAVERGANLVESGKAEFTGTRVSAQDVARFGSDDSANLVRYGDWIMAMEVWHGNDTMQTTGRARRIAEEHGANLYIDENGVGAGVQDRLNEMAIPSVGINCGERANDNEHYANFRSEAFWSLRQRFNKGLIQFHPDLNRGLVDRLIGELTSLHYKVNSQGRLIIESKEDIRKRGLPSPDLADALMMAFCYSGGGDAEGWTKAMERDNATLGLPVANIGGGLPEPARMPATNAWLDVMAKDPLVTEALPWLGPGERRL
jgi:hypothetical protein